MWAQAPLCVALLSCIQRKDVSALVSGNTQAPLDEGPRPQQAGVITAGGQSERLLAFTHWGGL